MRLLPSDHIGWWSAFFLARVVVFGAISFGCMFLLYFLLARSGVGMPPMWLVLVVPYFILEATIGKWLGAKERRRFGRQ